MRGASGGVEEGWLWRGRARGASKVRKNERLGPCYRGWIALGL